MQQQKYHKMHSGVFKPTVIIYCKCKTFSRLEFGTKHSHDVRIEGKVTPVRCYR